VHFLNEPAQDWNGKKAADPQELNPLIPKQKLVANRHLPESNGKVELNHLLVRIVALGKFKEEVVELLEATFARDFIA